MVTMVTMRGFTAIASASQAIPRETIGERDAIVTGPVAPHLVGPFWKMKPRKAFIERSVGLVRNLGLHDDTPLGIQRRLDHNVNMNVPSLCAMPCGPCDTLP